VADGAVPQPPPHAAGEAAHRPGIFCAEAAAEETLMDKSLDARLAPPEALLDESEIPGCCGRPFERG